MLAIRLKRMGTKKRPFYRVVVSDSRKRPTGRSIDVLGYYNPLPDPPVVRLDRDRAQAWLDRGAQPSDTVRSLIKRQSSVS